MTTPELTIEIDATTRYAAYYDTHPFSYLNDWDHDSWGLFTVAIDRQYKPLSLDTFGINDRLQTIVDRYSFSWNDNTLNTQLEKAITRAGYRAMTFSLTGYSQGDWAYVVVYWRDEAINDITGVLEELEAWFRGDVYTIALEKLETYKNESGSEKHYWECVESIGQVILTDSYRFTTETCSELLYAADIVAA